MSAHGPAERWAFLLALGDALRDLTDPLAIQAVACRTLGQRLKVQRVAYFEIAEGESEGIVRQDYTDGVASMVGRHPLHVWGAAHLDAWRAGTLAVVDDLRDDQGLNEAERARWRSIDVAAYLGITLAKGGRWVGALAAHSARPRRWEPEEAELIREVAELTWATIERARAESALRESERRYAAIFACAPFPTVLTRVTDKQVISVNAAFGRLFEIAPEELVGRTGEVLGGSMSEVRDRLWGSLRAGGSLRDLEGSVTLRSGAQLVLSFNIDHVMVGGEAHVLTTIRDLTELRSAEATVRRYEQEAALRRSEAKAASILATTADAILCVDQRLVITEWNASAERIFGYARTEAMGMPLERLLPERYRASHREQMLRFAAGSESARPMDPMSAVGVRKSGEEFPISAIIWRLEIDGEQLLTASVRDVSEQRRLEREQAILAGVGDALASLDHDDALRQLLRGLVSAMADFGALFVVEPGWALRRAVAISRDPAHQWAAELLLELSASAGPTHPVWQAVHTQRLICVEHDPDRYEEIARSPEHLRALRAARPVGAIVAPLVVRGKSVGVLGLATAARRFSAAEVRLIEEVARRCAPFVENALVHEAEQRAIRARDEMLAVVAHDLRSPLGIIVLQAGLLDDNDRATVRRDLGPAEAIDRAVGRMNRIIDDLLDVAQLDNGRIEIDRARVSPRALLLEVAEASRASAAMRSLELKIEGPAGPLPDVWGDRGRLLRILENLVGNALKVTTRGSVTLAARGGEGTDEGAVLFRVTDTGPGIAPGDLPHVFDRFWQGRRQERGSAGLGLAIVKGFVEVHGGRVWVESQRGVGTTFSFTVPVAPADAPAPLPPPGR